MIDDSQTSTARSEAAAEVEQFMHGLVRRNPGETEFHQAVNEFVEAVMPYVLEHPEYERAQYKRLENRFTGVRTGKGLAFGGSLVRTEATGYGVVYFTQNMLEHAGDSLRDKRCAISGSGNVAIYTAEKATELGARVVTMSDSDGTIHDPGGIDADKLAFIKDLKERRRGRLREYAERYASAYLDGERPWGVPCDLAFPCATQNEIEEADAQALIDGGCQGVIEGANMPTTLAAAHLLLERGVMFGPAKAANAGGVAVSGLEQSQNSLRISWSHEEVDQKLRDITVAIHRQCVEWGTENGAVNYVAGANLAGFRRIADAMLAYGTV